MSPKRTPPEVNPADSPESVTPATLDDLVPDPQNTNHGTTQGRAALECSLRDVGACRSVVVDRVGHILAGHKTIEEARRQGQQAQRVRTGTAHAG